MKVQTLLTLAVLLGAGAIGLSSARADSLVSTFTDPAFYGQANTTYQEWNGFSSAAGANNPTAWTNSAGTATWTDLTAGSDGGFPIGSVPNAQIYSFSGDLTPEIVVPNLDLGADYDTTIVLQVYTEGGSIPQSAFTLTPAGGTSTAPLSANNSSVADNGSGFDGSTFDTWTVTWVLPGNTTAYTIDYPVGGTSIAQWGARVDTAASVVPEPASLGMLGAGLGLLALRRRRVC